ncbi:MAG: glucosyltransferase domain-containing protein [Dokdonella sp.]
MTSAAISSDQTHRDRSTFFILLSLYFVVLFPILRANRYYNDDLKRALVGHQSWDATGRPLTTLLMRVLQYYDRAMVDISPLTQFGAIAILAWIGVLVARRYAINSPGMAALAAFPLGAQPFFMENLSYKFDALSMSLAMLLALVPILATSDDRRGWWLGVLSLFASLNLYQAAVNAYLVFIVLDIVLAQLKNRPPREVLQRLFSRILQAGMTMLIYQLIVGVHINGWVKQNSEKIHTLQELPLIAKNFIDTYAYIGASLNPQWWLYFGPVLIFLALIPVLVGIQYAHKQRAVGRVGEAATLLVASFLMPLVALVCVLGPMLILVKPLIQPRVLMGVGALLAVGLIVSCVALKAWGRSERWSLGLASMLALGMCTFASAYGNALGEQKNYEERIASRLADDLAEVRAMHSIHAFLLDGTAGYSPVAAHVIGQLPLVGVLVPTYISADDMFHTHMFLRYFMRDDISDMRLRTDADAMHARSMILSKAGEAPVTIAREAYELRLIDGVALVTFRSAGAEPVSGNDPAAVRAD